MHAWAVQSTGLQFGRYPSLEVSFQGPTESQQVCTTCFRAWIQIQAFGRWSGIFEIINAQVQGLLL